MTFTPDKLHALEKAHAKAVEKNEAIFTFAGAEFSTTYAKYLIEYLQGVFK